MTDKEKTDKFLREFGLDSEIFNTGDLRDILLKLNIRTPKSIHYMNNEIAFITYFNEIFVYEVSQEVIDDIKNHFHIHILGKPLETCDGIFIFDIEFNDKSFQITKKCLLDKTKQK